MNQQRFASLTQSLTTMPSRRDVLCGLAGAALGLSAGRIPHITEAKKKRKKRKKARPNAFGCLSVGVACKSADQCCSGICDGKKGKRTCRAHGAGTCRQDLRGVCLVGSGDDLLLHVCNNNTNCYCHRTTAGSNYCSRGLSTPSGENRDERCADCQTDADCVALGFPPGSACAPVSQGLCAGYCPTGMACLDPCGEEPE